MHLRLNTYVFIETLVGSAVNAVISAVIGYLTFRSYAEVSLWGSPSLALDFLPQTFMVALVSALIPTFLTRQRLRTGRVEGLTRRVVALPQNVVTRSLMVASAVLVVVGGPLVGVLWFYRIGPLPITTVVWIKLSYGALVSALVTPICVWVALSDKP